MAKKDDGAVGSVDNLFDRMKASLADTEAKKKVVADLVAKLDEARSALNGALDAHKGLQAEYQQLVGGVDPSLASGVTSSQ